MAVGAEDDRRSPRLGFGRPNRSSGCRLRRRDGVPGRFGSKAAFLFGGSLVPRGGLGDADENPHPPAQRTRSACYAISIRETTTEFGSRSGTPHQRLEEDPLARRIKGLVGVAVRCGAGATLAWVRGWRTAT